MRTRLERRHGFTLIELLVVIAIIAILAAILFPVFARARAKARQAQCLSNMKQVAMGLTMYAQDYDETLPYYSLSANKPAAGVNAYTWDTAVGPYIKSTQIFTCPDNSFNSQTNDIGESGPKRGYALPRYVSGQPIGAPTAVASTVLLLEKGAYKTGTWQDCAAELPTQAGFSKIYGTDVAYRHNGGNNFAFADGHAKWIAVGKGPWSDNGSGACPGTGGGGYEDHQPGHCEFAPQDWPQQ
jgi:prepilin-type N-terminal cleavage/methylation domain-containing protein/prepilin-type processing-associated H-X9-DG protein